MLTLELQLLRGCYVATEYNDRQKAEWPPHPARVFSALVAAHYEALEPDQEERIALEWLAEAEPPKVLASVSAPRTVTSVYVPTNDPPGIRSKVNDLLVMLHHAERESNTSDAATRRRAHRDMAKIEEKLIAESAKHKTTTKKLTLKNGPPLLPSRRPRQARTFPVTLPQSHVVHLVWSSQPEGKTIDLLDRLAARVARIGHSSSLISARFFRGAPEVGERQEWKPQAGGDLLLRVPLPDQMEQLDLAHALHQQVAPRTLACGYASYGLASPKERALAASVFAEADWLVFKVVLGQERRRRLLDASMAQYVAKALRGTIMSFAGDEALPMITGHDDREKPSQNPHAAYVPLPFVGHPHATGSILGVAIVPPRTATPEDMAALFRAVAAAEAASDNGILALRLPRGVKVRIQRVSHPERKALQPRSWSELSRRWATVTPIALDRNPGDLRSTSRSVCDAAHKAAEEIIRRSCDHVGLPQPAEVWLHSRSLFAGSPKAREFGPYPAFSKGPRRVLVHAEIRFEQPVLGPVLLGAGRYLGLGLFRGISDSVERS